VLPDFIANAGGVICAAVEYRSGTEAAALAMMDEKICTNTEIILGRRSASASCRAPRQWRWLPSGCTGQCGRGDGMRRLHQLSWINVRSILAGKM
jgi:hypothetical protein